MEEHEKGAGEKAKKRRKKKNKKKRETTLEEREDEEDAGDTEELETRASVEDPDFVEGRQAKEEPC